MEQEPWTPADLLQLSGGYWSACAVHAGVKLNVFTPLSARSHSATDLARDLAVDSRGLSMLLNALCALGLLSKEGDSYSVTPFSREYLSRDSDRYLGHILLHHHHLMESWGRLDEGVKRGGPVASRISHGEDERYVRASSWGCSLAMQLAPLIVSAIDLSVGVGSWILGGGPEPTHPHTAITIQA